MKHNAFHSSERGSAILLTLGILTIVLVLALVFAMTSRNARTIATANADALNAGMVAESAVNRATGMLNHLGGNGVNTVSITSVNGTYNHLPYLGHFFNNAENANKLPILKAQEITGNSGDLAQYLFYTHKDADDDRSLYDLLTSTPYGTFLKDKCTAFAALANSGANQLQFIPVKDSKASDSHYIARYGFVVLHEGAKFDINQIVKPDSVIPYVKDGELVNLDGNPDELATFAAGKSIYPVMGLADAAKEKVDASSAVPTATDITENQTLRYGLHPQELRATNGAFDTELALGEASKPPKWYNYDSLISRAGTAFAENDNFFLYSVTSGGKDREVRFTGTETDYDDTNPANRKVDLQLPNGATWDKINEYFVKDASADNFKEQLEGTAATIPASELGISGSDQFSMPSLLGLPTGLFKADDGTTPDLTAQVMANLIDFCSDDGKATYVAKYKKSSSDTEARLSFTSEADPTASFGDADNDPVVLCGNVRAPYISGVAISITPDGEVTSKAEVKKYFTDVNHSVETSVSLWHWNENWTTEPKLKMRLRAVTANLFPMDIEKELHYKFLVRGKVCIYYRVKPNQKITEKTGTNTLGNPATYYEITPNPVTEFYVGQQYDGNGATADAVTNWVLLETGDYVKDATPDDTFFEKNAIDFVCTATADAAQPQTALEFRQDILTSVTDLTLPTDAVKKPSNIEGCVNGYGVAFVITDVVVMSSYDNAAMTDLAYFRPHNLTDGKMTDSNVSWKTSSVVAIEPTAGYDVTAGLDFTAKFNTLVIGGTGGNDDKSALETMFAVKDPRFNHKTSGWGFVKPVDGTAYTNEDAAECTGNTAPEFDRISNANVLVDEVANFSVEYFLKNCKNDGSTGIDKDWEPELVAEAALSGSAVAGTTGRKLTTTLSTAFIPNGPITSLWQLGAIHRGEAGRTLNLKKFGGAGGDKKYATGDAWILDYFKLSELGVDDSTDDTDLRTPEAVCGKFNPNCFNEGAYLYFLSYLPKGDDANDTAIYLPLTSNLSKNIGDQLTNGDFTTGLGLKFVDSFADNADNTISKQSWSPVEAFYNFVEVDNTAANLNDREAEKFIGCSAGIMSTRYETFTVLAAGQSLRYIMPDSTEVTADFQKTLVNPVKIGTDWYSILGTQLRIVTLVRDCWANRIKVVNVRNL